MLDFLFDPMELALDPMMPCSLPFTVTLEFMQLIYWKLKMLSYTVERLSGELAHEDDDGHDEPDGDPAEGEEHVRVAQRDRLAVTPADVVRLAWQKESINAEVATSSS